MKKISILGSTGSIGVNTLNVISSNPGTFEVTYLTAGRNSKLLCSQAKKYRPKAVAIADETQFSYVKSELSSMDIKVFCGKEGIIHISKQEDVDLVSNSIVGAPGLAPTYYAVKAGHSIALSNKESLVMAGELIMPMLKEKGLKIFPVDSEHSAIWQCLIGEKTRDINRIILTGSGGPFRTLPLEEFPNITPDKALKHPTWNMGKKITIDSATMMNKGLEVIEAKWLFDLPASKIEVIIHPQSIIHSMVEFVDGSIKAQLGEPDMKLPIQYALYYPERRNVRWEYTDFAKIGELNFEAPNLKKFPAIQLAFDVLKRGGTSGAILNVVNELAVYAFLENKIKFTQIPSLIEKSLSEIKIIDNPELNDIFDAEQLAGEFVKREIAGWQ